MAFTVKTLAQIRDAQLRDISNQQPEADTGSDSDHFVRSSATASSIEGLYEHQAWISRQIFPDSADEENLKRHAALRRIFQKPAVAASGSIRAKGAPGAALQSGLAGVAGGQVIVTTASAIVGADGTVVVNAAVGATGTAGNLAADTPGQFGAAPSGVASEFQIVTMRGGLEIETPDQLLSRLLARLQDPPAGGKTSDYRGWALEVPGITGAYVFPHRTAVGKVDVAVISGNGLASEEQIIQAQLNIDRNRPAGARGATVFVPTLKVVDFALALQGDIDPDIALPQLYTSIGAYFDTLQPGAPMVKSRIEAIVSDTQAVIDRRIDAPPANVVPVVSPVVVEWLRLGTISLSELV